MGACCCSAYKGVGLNTSPAYYHYQVASEEHEPLSNGCLVNTNLETSIPDTYIPPPAPLPYAFNLRIPSTPSRSREKNSGEIISVSNNSEISNKNPREGDRKVKSDGEFASSEATVEFEEIDDLKKSSKAYVPEEEEDDCPICLEEYDDDNPKLLTQCAHHFHLACILDWMERSDFCPVCDKEVIIDPSLAS